MITATSNFITAANAFSNGELRVFIQISGYHRAFSNFDPTGFTWDDSIAEHNDWLLMEETDDLVWNVNDLDGGADVQNWGFTVQDVNNLVTADFAGFTFEGKAVTVKVGFKGLSIDDYCTIFTGNILSVESVDSNLNYHFSCEDTTGYLSRTIFGTADDGFETSSDHLRTVEGHPLDILLDILSTQVGLSAGKIDTAKIEEYRDGIFAGMKLVFHLDQAVTAGDFIKAQIMKPLGGYIWTTADGKVTANFFYPIAGPTPVATFGADTWLSIPSAEMTDMVNTVQFKFDKDSSVNGTADYASNHTEGYAPSIAKYGQYGTQTIEADGLRSAFQGYFIAALTARLLFLRYGYKNLKFDQDAAEAIFSTMRCEIGDVVAVTHTRIPDRSAGVMGVTSKLFEILSKTLSLRTGRVTFTMIDATYLASFGFYKITSDAQADYASATTGEKAAYMFMTNDAGLYSNGDAGHGLG